MFLSHGIEIIRVPAVGVQQHNRSDGSFSFEYNFRSSTTACSIAVCNRSTIIFDIIVLNFFFFAGEPLFPLLPFFCKLFYWSKKLVEHLRDRLEIRFYSDGSINNVIVVIIDNLTQSNRCCGYYFDRHYCVFSVYNEGDDRDNHSDLKYNWFVVGKYQMVSGSLTPEKFNCQIKSLPIKPDTLKRNF